MLALAAAPLLAQNHKNDAPHPSHQAPAESHPSRILNRSHVRNFNLALRPSRRGNLRPTLPAARRSHHSGQWLGPASQSSLEQQRQALQNDRDFAVSARAQQKFDQRLSTSTACLPSASSRFCGGMETWEHLTPQQKEQFRAADSQFKSLPPDRRQAVKMPSRACGRCRRKPAAGA